MMLAHRCRAEPLGDQLAHPVVAGTIRIDARPRRWLLEQELPGLAREALLLVVAPPGSFGEDIER